MKQSVNKKPKILVIVGPTASGKSDLAVELAKKYAGEVISADSRQVYRGLNIATGKITKEEMKGIPHHLLDIAEPNDQYTVAQFKEDAEQAIDDILSRKKLPIIAGGTGFYIQAVVDNITSPEVPPNKELRNELESREETDLFRALEKLDPIRAASIDPNNKRRLVRALEIIAALGQVPPQTKNSRYEVLQIGIKTSTVELQKRIKMRVQKRIDLGMIEEAHQLHKDGLSYKRMDELGMEYRLLAQCIKNNITNYQFIDNLIIENRQYAKRQMTWFRKDTRIKWFSLNQIPQIEEEVKRFLYN